MRELPFEVSRHSAVAGGDSGAGGDIGAGGDSGAGGECHTVHPCSDADKLHHAACEPDRFDELASANDGTRRRFGTVHLSVVANPQRRCNDNPLER